MLLQLRTALPSPALVCQMAQTKTTSSPVPLSLTHRHVQEATIAPPRPLAASVVLAPLLLSAPLEFQMVCRAVVSQTTPGKASPDRTAISVPPLLVRVRISDQQQDQTQISSTQTTNLSTSAVVSRSHAVTQILPTQHNTPQAQQAHKSRESSHSLLFRLRVDMKRRRIGDMSLRSKSRRTRDRKSTRLNSSHWE